MTPRYLAVDLGLVVVGVEICETNGGNATFEFADFSITTH
jgi:hypothetical protein